MKHGNGVKGRDDKSSGVEILMTETFTKINPLTLYCYLSKKHEHNKIDPIAPVFRQSEPMFHGEDVGIIND